MPGILKGVLGGKCIWRRFIDMNLMAYNLPLLFCICFLLLYICPRLWPTHVRNYLLPSGYIVSIPNESSQISHLPYPTPAISSSYAVFVSSSRFTFFLSPFPLPLLLAKSTSRVFIGILCCGCLPGYGFVDKFVKWVSGVVDAAFSMADLCESPSLLYTFDRDIGVSFVRSIFCILTLIRFYVRTRSSQFGGVSEANPRRREERTKCCANKCQLFPFILERCLRYLRSYWVDFIAR